MGIELVSVAHKLQPDLEMVIFSGYGEFAYAKKAMASGVSNYVLKPVDPAEFENTLNLLVEKITERRNGSAAQSVESGFSGKLFSFQIPLSGKCRSVK